MFTDNIDENIELLEELLRGMPPTARKRAQGAAGAVEKAVGQLRKDHPSDPAVALGVAWIVHKIAQQIVQQETQADSDKPGLIEVVGS
jgi:hypothetical protein